MAPKKLIDVERLPLQDLFDRYLGVGRVDTQEEYDGMVKKQEAYLAAHPDVTAEEAIREIAKEELKDPAVTE